MALCSPGAFLTHQQKVLRLYKRALRHLESWIVFRDEYRFRACLLRARFEEHKNEKDMVKATTLLMKGEEEFWANQHPQPYIFPDSPGGTSFERYECYKVPEWCLDYWHPSEKAMYPDYFAKREKWKKLRLESWDRECREQTQGKWYPHCHRVPGITGWNCDTHAADPLEAILARSSSATFTALSSDSMQPHQVQQLKEETSLDGPKTEALPPARKEGHLPPLWWHIVTRPRERPS